MNKNFAYDVSATTLENAMLALGQSANANANSGVYKINDVTNMTKAGQWNLSRPTYDREDVAVGTTNQPRIASSIIRSGRMILNGNFAGMYDFAYHDGNLDLDNVLFSGSKFDTMLFSDNQDTHWALIYINGNLTLDHPNIIRPPVRKLGMCIYVTGNFIANGFVSMTDRGANHSGTGISGGYTAPVAIPLNGTLTIPAAGGAGGARGSDAPGGGTSVNNGTAAGGSGTGTYCGTGGGGSGLANVVVSGDTLESGAGTDGTCFTGGTGGCGFNLYAGDNTTAGAELYGSLDAVANGGAGGSAAAQAAAVYHYGSKGGCGNPGGYRVTSASPHYVVVGNEYGEQVADNDVQSVSSQSRPPTIIDGFNGTGGTCVTMVAGTYSGSGKFRSTGHSNGNYHDGSANGGGGASGGGVNIVLYGTDSSGPTPTSAGGSGGDYYGGGNAGAGTGLKAAL